VTRSRKRKRDCLPALGVDLVLHGKTSQEEPAVDQRMVKDGVSEMEEWTVIEKLIGVPLCFDEGCIFY